MKALISRDSHRPGKRYSGVYHIQGAMITDADLDERSDIARDRTDFLGNDSIRDGVPADGGAVAIAGNGTVSLREGIIYADGVRGILRDGGGRRGRGPLSLFDRQADLPLGPDLPATGDVVVYADLWERPVFPLEDPYLADVGLHGAVTGFRTRTMTQLKAAPATALADIEAGTGAFPKIGTARLAVTPLNAEILADECDPCADVVPTEQQVANALWRLEIISIEGTPDHPTSVMMAWSEENASEIAPAAVSPETFERANKVYEYFSPITEARAGVYANSADAKRPTFVDDLATAPTPPQDHDGKSWRFLRRWDGVATISPGGNQIASSLGGGFQLSMSGGKIALRVAAFEAEIDLNGAAVVPGDYWLVEMRRHAPQAERIRLVQPTPIGIRHHYCTLFNVSDGNVVPLTDAQRRKLSFPPLSNLPADHVRLINNCEKLYGRAENVQDALDNLCSISAADIGFNSANCPKLYDNAQTVQEALDALCRINFSVEESFRLLFDWGVVCGLVPKLVTANTGKIAISPGSYLDRSGSLVKFQGGAFDLSTLAIGSGIEFPNADAFQAALRKGEVCLALAAGEGGKTSLHLVPQAIAFGPPDPSFSEKLRECVQRRRFIQLPEVVASLPRRQQVVANKLFLASSAEGAFHGTARLTNAEFAEAQAISGRLAEAFSAVASEEEKTLLNERFEAVRLANPIVNATGATREIRQMQQSVALIDAFRETDEQRLRRCTCELLLPPCPPNLGSPPFFVPIACVRGGIEGPAILLNELCAYCCRKQAMTWHTLQYFIGDMRTRMAKEFAEICCAKTERTATLGPAFHPQALDRINLVSFVEDHGLVNRFLDRRETLPGNFTTRLQVKDLSVAAAVREIRGMGLEVAETVDVGDAKAFETLQGKLAGIAPEDLLVSRGEVRPGDKVALLAQGGTVQGYVLVERGSGKLPFETSGAGVLAEEDVQRVDELVRKTAAMKEEFVSLEKARADVVSATERLRTETGELQKQQEAATAAVAAVRSQVGELDKTRGALAADIARLRTEASELSTQRDALATAVAAVRGQIGDLTKTRGTLAVQIEEANSQLVAIQASHKALIDSMRESQPLNVVLGTDRAKELAALAGEGITTVGDIAKLSPALTRRLERILKADELAELRTKAAELLKRP